MGQQQDRAAGEGIWTDYVRGEKQMYKDVHSLHMREQKHTRTRIQTNSHIIKRARKGNSGPRSGGHDERHAKKGKALVSLMFPNFSQGLVLAPSTRLKASWAVAFQRVQ